MVPASELRVYEPLESFPDDERHRWERYIGCDQAPPRPSPYAQTMFTGEDQADHIALLYPMADEHAWIRRVNGGWLVCPWSMRVGVLTGILSFRDCVAEDVAETLLPDEALDRASWELESLRSGNPSARDNVVVAAWHVPFRWLAAFDDAERILTAEQPPGLRASGHPARRTAVRLRYETDIAQAIGRLNRARDILEEAGMEEVLVAPVAELVDWLSSFHKDSTLELDYASLAGLLPPDELEADRSAGEIWACLEAMELGDLDESRRRYRDLSAWWDRVRSVERAN